MYICEQCAATTKKWAGQCADCGAWNSMVEMAKTPSLPHHKTPKSSTRGQYAGEKSEVLTLNQVGQGVIARLPTGINEFDRVLGGGLVAGSVVLIGGDPGIGKSTILLQTTTHMARADSAAGSALYITGEESLSQVAMRATRLGLPTDRVQVMAQTDVDKIIHALSRHAPTVAVVDSIQTLYTDAISGAPGGVSQIKETAALLTRFAKKSGTALFLVGHVTKDGALAGPRVLEHMVDAVLYFEGQADSRYRMIRAIKNRFGAVNELGIFAMGDDGLKQVANPSAIFLSREAAVAGSVVMVTREGTRPLLVEVQALVDDASGTPRRMAIGLDAQRLGMLLAVLHRHGGIHMSGQDVYVNVVGGVKVLETGSDLAVLLACASSLKARALPMDLAVFGEVGLAGEIRPVPSGQERIKEAQKHGFKTIILPHANLPKTLPSGIQIFGVKRLDEALDAAFSSL